jgi:hypothetical protein
LSFQVRGSFILPGNLTYALSLKGCFFMSEEYYRDAYGFWRIKGNRKRNRRMIAPCLKYDSL